MSTNEALYLGDDDELPSTADSITNALNELRATADTVSQFAVADARNRITQHPSYQTITNAGRMMRAAYITDGQHRDRLKTRSDLSEKGRIQAAQSLDSARANVIAGIREQALEAEGDAMLDSFPEPTMPSPSPAARAAIELARGGISQALPVDVEYAALMQVRRALSAKDPSDKAEALQLLAHVYGPVVRRRGVSPESFAMSRKESAAEIAALVDHVLHVGTGGVAHRMAQAAVGRARRAFDGLSLMLDSQNGGRWDDVIARTAAPMFTWADA